MPVQDVVGPLALQGPQQWLTNAFDWFDDMDLMSSADYSKMPLEVQLLSWPFSNPQVPMNYVPQMFYLDHKHDH